MKRPISYPFVLFISFCSIYSSVPKTPLCVYVKVVYNTNFRDECGGLVADAEQAATDVFKRAQEVFTTFQGLDRSINLQLVGCKTNSALHFNLTVQVNSIAFFAKTGDLQRKLKTKN